ncbi:DUF1120 domain-containing protein [Escherichia coli]|nr:DUF1120 domain-containing protein [Escherichia coli]
MKKLTLIATLVASAMSFSSHAATTSASVNITGSIVPSACAISASANGGTIDFGKILSSELGEQGVTRKAKKDTLTITCDKDTTAVVKVSGSNGVDGNTYNSDKDFVKIAVQFTDVNVTGGNATNKFLVSNAASVDLDNLTAAGFTTAAGNKPLFPFNGNYLAVADTNNSVGTFKTLTANYSVSAVVQNASAKRALTQGEQTFGGAVTFELNYL